jgi:hypothetical protein
VSEARHSNWLGLRENVGRRDNAWSGKVKWVQIDAAGAAKDVDHLIGAEERSRVYMARK